MSDEYADVPEEEVEADVLRCEKCGSTNWECVDERAFNCWNRDGWHVGDRIVGYLRCKDCQNQWTDISVDPSLEDEDCECEDF